MEAWGSRCRPCLSSEALADEDLAAALHSLVGGDVARLEGAPVPLFLRDDWEQVVNSMPAFNGDGPVPAEVPEDLAARTMVNVSSSDSGREEEEEGQEEEPDYEATDGESREPLPQRRSRALRLMLDDDEDGDERGGESSPLIPKKDRTGLVPRGSTPAPRRSADAPPAPEPLEVDPSSRLSGFKFGRRLLEPASDDE